MFAVRIVVTAAPTVIRAIWIEFAGIAGSVGDAAAVPATTANDQLFVAPE
jgi:hypothetical protein